MDGLPVTLILEKIGPGSADHMGIGIKDHGCHGENGEYRKVMSRPAAQYKLGQRDNPHGQQIKSCQQENDSAKRPK